MKVLGLEALCLFLTKLVFMYFNPCFFQMDISQFHSLQRPFSTRNQGKLLLPQTYLGLRDIFPKYSVLILCQLMFAEPQKQTVLRKKFQFGRTVSWKEETFDRQVKFNVQKWRVIKRWLVKRVAPHYYLLIRWVSKCIIEDLPPVLCCSLYSGTAKRNHVLSDRKGSCIRLGR